MDTSLCRLLLTFTIFVNGKQFPGFRKNGNYKNFHPIEGCSKLVQISWNQLVFNHDLLANSILNNGLVIIGLIYV